MGAQAARDGANGLSGCTGKPRERCRPGGLHFIAILMPHCGGLQSGAFWGTYGAAHECMHVVGMPQRIAMIACDVSITFPHLYATCSHYMSHAMHIGDMLCLCVRAQNDFYCWLESPQHPSNAIRLEHKCSLVKEK